MREKEPTMALHLRAKRPVLTTKLLGASVAVLALLLQPFGALPLPVASAASTSDVWIKSAMPDPAGSDEKGEYVVLENKTSSTINLSGWSLSDNTTSFNLSGIMGPSATLKICSETDSTSTAIGCGLEWASMSLANAGETLTLRESTEIIDQVTYSSSASGVEVVFASHTTAPVVAVNPVLGAEEFVTNNGSYKGISVGFNASGFGTVSNVSVAITREDGTIVTKTANAGVRDLISNQIGPVQLTAPFVIQEGTFTEASDIIYWQPAIGGSWSSVTRPVSVLVSVTDENGTKAVSNTSFIEANGVTYESLLPALSVPDTEKPTVELLNPEAGSYNPTQYQVKAIDDKKLEIVTANLYKGSDLLKSCSERNLDASEYTLTCPVPADLANGTYSIRYNAKDQASKLSQTMSSTFMVDTTDPTATLKNTSVGNVDQRILKEADFKLYDNNKLRAYIVNETRTQVSPNQWSDANDIKVGSRGGQYGRNEIKVEDMAGNVSEPFVFYLDNKAPRADVKSESLGDASEATFRQVSFKLYDEHKINKIVVNSVEKDLSDNQWSDLNNVKPGAFGAREGNNTLVVYDVAGNTFNYEFVLDTTLPVASVQSPADGDQLEGTVPVVITANDETKLAAYSYRIKNTETGTTVVNRVVTSESGVTEAEVLTWDTKSFENGEYYVYVSARDVAGNRSEQRIYVTVANEGPAVSVASPVDAQVVDQNLDVAFSATDPSLLGAYCVKINGGSCVANGYRYQPEDGRQYTVSVDVSGLPEGSHETTVRVTDRAGNATERVVGFMIDRAEEPQGGETGIPGPISGDDNDNPDEVDESPINQTPSVQPTQTGGTTSGPATAPQFTPAPQFVAAINNGSQSNQSEQESETQTEDDGDILGTSSTEDEDNGDVAGASDKAGWSIGDMAWYWWVAGVLGLMALWLLIAAGIRRLRGTDA